MTSNQASAAVYCRISRDDEGDGLGVQRQERLCRSICRRNSWSVAQVLTDNDVSASGKKRRPAFEELLSLVESGSVQVVVALDLDRLVRTHKDLLRVVEACVAHRVRVAFDREAGFDPVTGDGMMEVEIRTSVANEELRKVRTRTRRQKRERAERGLSNGGPRPFGYTSSKRTAVNQREARSVREAAERYLRGASLGDVTRWLNGQKAYTTQGTPWTVSRVRRMLWRADLAGLREVKDGDEVIDTVPAAWKAILTTEQHERLRARLTANGSRHRSPSQYLLSPPEPLVFCDRCGGVMAGAGAKSQRRYKCKGATGCGLNGMRADWLEDHVVTLALGFATHPDVVQSRREERQKARSESEAIRAELAKLDDEERWLNDFAVEVEMKPTEYRRKLGDLATRREQYERKLGKVQSAEEAVTESGGVEEARRRWDSLTFNEKRRVLRSLLIEVRVKPVKTGRNTFDPTRITIRPDWGPTLEAARRGNPDLVDPSVLREG